MKCGDIVFDKETGQIGEVIKEGYTGVDLILSYVFVIFGKTQTLFRGEQLNQLIKFRELDELVFMKDEMVQHKVARILNGDPRYDDNWVDIAGYSTLVAQRLKQQSAEK